MRIATLICLFFQVISLIEEDNDVLVLTDSNFNDALKMFPKLLVEFYAPWCAHCKVLAPLYAKAATTLKAHDPPFRIAKIDGTANPKANYLNHIEGYPSLKFFVNGEPTDYKGPRSEEGIVEYVLKKMGPPASHLENLSELKSYNSAHKLSIVLFASKGSDEEKLFEKIVEASDGNYYVIISDEQACVYFNVKEPTVVAFKHYDNLRSDFTGPFTQEELSKFIELNQVPWIMTFDDNTIQQVFGKQRPALFFFRKNEDAGVYDPMLVSLSFKTQGSVLLIYADLLLEFNKRLAEFLGVPASVMPKALLLDSSMNKYIHNGALDELSLIQFIDNWKRGTLHPYYRTQPVPDKEFEDGVRILVGSTFGEAVFDENKDVIVEFFAPWCGNCKKLAGEYKKVAKHFKKNPNVLIAKLDSTENEVHGHQISNYPIIKMFPANNKTGIEYTGTKDANGIIKFIEEYMSAKTAKVDL